jgi:hypothetical protein
VRGDPGVQGRQGLAFSKGSPKKMDRNAAAKFEWNVIMNWQTGLRRPSYSEFRIPSLFLKSDGFMHNASMCNSDYSLHFYGKEEGCCVNTVQ